MREIKFRGLTANNEFVYGDLRYDYPGSTAYFDEYPHRICWYLENGGSANAPVKKGTVGQFTGLRDSKRTAEYPEGQEIYEGDIVITNKPTYDSEPHKNVVIFDNALFQYRCNGINDIPCGYYSSDEVEVIGNIYENPLFLGGQPNAE